jgi:hypothetical protein
VLYGLAKRDGSPNTLRYDVTERSLRRIEVVTTGKFAALITNCEVLGITYDTSNVYGEVTGTFDEYSIKYYEQCTFRRQRAVDRLAKVLAACTNLRTLTYARVDQCQTPRAPWLVMKQQCPGKLLKSLNNAAESRQVRPQLNPWAGLMDVIRSASSIASKFDSLILKDVIPDMSKMSLDDMACLNAFVRKQIVSMEILSKDTESRLRDFKHGRGREVNAWTGFLGSAAESVKSITTRTTLMPTFNKMTSEHSLVSMICATKWPKLSTIHFEEVTFKPSELGTLLLKHKNNLERVTIHDCETRSVDNGTIIVGAQLNRTRKNVEWFETLAGLLLWMKRKQRLQTVDYRLPLFARDGLNERQKAYMDLLSPMSDQKTLGEDLRPSTADQQAVIAQMYQTWGRGGPFSQTVTPAQDNSTVMQVRVGDVSAFLVAREQHVAAQSSSSDQSLEATEQDDSSEQEEDEEQAESDEQDDGDDLHGEDKEDDEEDQEGLDMLLAFQLSRKALPQNASKHTYLSHGRPVRRRF